eukprot:548981-Hanusia_phi.AAC.1
MLAWGGATNSVGTCISRLSTLVKKHSYPTTYPGDCELREAVDEEERTSPRVGPDEETDGSHRQQGDGRQHCAASRHVSSGNPPLPNLGPIFETRHPSFYHEKYPLLSYL